jgi:Zn finger protein HypA/HybF involved in hydrogenase expression
MIPEPGAVCHCRICDEPDPPRCEHCDADLDWGDWGWTCPDCDAEEVIA